MHSCVVCPARPLYHRHRSIRAYGKVVGSILAVFATFTIANAGVILEPAPAQCPTAQRNIAGFDLARFAPLWDFCAGDGRTIRYLDPLNPNRQLFTVLAHDPTAPNALFALDFDPPKDEPPPIRTPVIPTPAVFPPHQPDLPSDPASAHNPPSIPDPPTPPLPTNTTPEPESWALCLSGAVAVIALSSSRRTRH